jgi:hypothetical protein
MPDFAAYVDAAAGASDLRLDAAMRAGAIANLQRTHGFARLLEDDSDPSATEPAPVFAPVATDLQ